MADTKFKMPVRAGSTAAIRPGITWTGTTMMRQKRLIRRITWTALVLATLNGCERQVFVDKGDYEAALATGPLAKLSTQPHGPILPPAVTGTDPATVLDPSRPARNVTLKEVMAITLEQGNVGSPSVNQPGNASDTFSAFTGRGSTGTDNLAAFAMDPAIAGAEIERSLSKFDARWVSSMTWQKIDQPFAVGFQSFLQNSDQAVLSSTLAKPLPTGGTAGITFNMNYNNLTNPPPPNSQFAALPTSYQPQVQFSFEQPLLQAFGVEINQLLPNHPGSVLIPGLRPSGGQGTEGILVTRLRLGQQRSEFDRQLNLSLLNAEAAYWNLYSAYYNLYAQEEALKQSQFAYLIFRDRADAGITRRQFAIQAKAQVELFRGQVLTARGQVLLSERQLRGIMGLRSDDGTRLVPADEPTLVEYQPNYYDLANESMQFRPELLIARQELKAQQLNLVLQRNQRQPDLRLVSQYDVQGIGSRLDGRPDQNALGSLTDNRFNSWTLGLRLDIPLGFRDANALVRQAELSMRKSYYYLIDSERKTLENLTEQYRQVVQAYELVQYRRAQREDLQEYIALDRQVLETGALNKDEYVGFISNLIQVQRDLANATASEFQAVAQYNIALAGLEYAKGTIQQYNNLTVADGPVPAWVEKKAVDHFKAREAALNLVERPAGLPLSALHQWSPMADLPGTDPAVIPPGATLPTGVPAALPPLHVTPEDPQGTQPGIPSYGYPSTNPSQPWNGSEPLPTPTPVPTPTGSPSVSVPVAPPVNRTSSQPTTITPVASETIGSGTISFPQEGTVKLRKRPGQTIPVKADAPQVAPVEMPIGIPTLPARPVGATGTGSGVPPILSSPPLR